MIVGMGDTVLAGPVEFSPADIALILAVLAGLFVAVMTPGWAVLGWAFARRRQARGPGRSWPHAVAGFATGLGVCGAVSAAVGGTTSSGSAAGVVAVLLSWGACWLLAWLVRRRTPAADRQPAQTEGWGR